MVFYQLLERIQWIHKHHYIHLDIKPNNIMLGLAGASHTVHMIDFGLSRLVIDQKTGDHIPIKKKDSIVGTCQYISINAHKGY